MKNSTQLIGRIGTIETKRFDSPKDPAKQNVVTNVSLAIEDNYYNAQNELVERTQWITVVSNGKIAEYLEQRFAKGDQLAITGKLKSRSYVHPTANIEIYVTEVQITEIVWQACIYNRPAKEQ